VPCAHVRFAFRLSPLACIHHEGHFHKSRKQIATDGHCPNKFLYFGRCACSGSCNNPGAQAKKRRIKSTAVRGTLRRSKYLPHHKTAASKRAKQSPAPEVACSLQPAPSSLQPATNLQPSIREARKPATCKPANLQPCNAWACKQPTACSRGLGAVCRPTLMARSRAPLARCSRKASANSTSQFRQ
jgi:hypothetical protein